MNSRTPVQTLLLAVGGVVMIGGLVCVVAGFADFAGSDAGTGGDGALMLFAAGGFAMVVGFGIIAFTRAAILTRGGAYSRVTIEHGRPPAGGRFCSACGVHLSASARFCESCGAPVG